MIRCLHEIPFFDHPDSARCIIDFGFVVFMSLVYKNGLVGKIGYQK